MPPVKSDARWISEFKARYASWWAGALPLIEKHDYASAFKTYPWPTFAQSPWAAVTKPLRRSRIAVVTTGGLFRPGDDLPFDGKAPEGEWSFRAIPRTVEIQKLGIAHPHFAHEVAEADMNTIFPLERLEDLKRSGVIGDLAPTHFSIMGYCTRAADLAETSAPEIAAQLEAEEVDAALVVPV